jgi:hypothetical protein
MQQPLKPQDVLRLSRRDYLTYKYRVLERLRRHVAPPPPAPREVAKELPPLRPGEPPLAVPDFRGMTRREYREFARQDGPRRWTSAFVAYLRRKAQLTQE